MGLDELTVAGQNHVTALRDGSISSFVVEAEDAGLSRAPVEAIRGGDAGFNASALEAMLQGATGAYRDTVLLNAAAALVVAGRVGDLREGVSVAAGSIASGAAFAALETLRRVSAVTVS
jgi:anthranilate phosphoribosyltransferase